MKKIFSFILLILAFASVSNADNIRIISQTDNSVTLQRTYTAYETTHYQKVGGTTNVGNNQFVSSYKNGNVGIALHFGYGDMAFSHVCPEPEIGAQLYYNFAAKDKVKFGIGIGFDYASTNWNFNNGAYWNMRTGIIICKYVGIGYVGGPKIGQPNSKWNNGIYGNIYMPFSGWIGLFIDAKYVWGQGGTVGGGLFIQMNTNAAKINE